MHFKTKIKLYSNIYYTGTCNNFILVLLKIQSTFIELLHFNTPLLEYCINLIHCFNI